MEDSHTVSLNLDGLEEDIHSNTFFAVYDGHGGTRTFGLSFSAAERVE